MKKLKNKNTDANEVRKIIRRAEWNVYSILELIAIALGIWFLFYPHPYTVLFTALVLIPLFGILFSRIDKRKSIASLLVFSKNHKGNERFELQFFFLITAWIISIRVFLDFQFERFQDAIIPCVIGFILFTIILLISYSFRVKTKISKWKVYLPIIIHSVLYSFSSIIGINCIYDFSTPDAFEVKVIDKKSNKRKGRMYYEVKMDSWCEIGKPLYSSVNEKTYQSVEIGDSLVIERKKGLLGIAWYYIVE